MSGKQKKKSRKKATKNSITKRCLSAFTALFLWYLLCAFGYVWCQVQVVNLGYSLSKLHRLHTQLVNDNKKLHLELARLRAPERIERIAVEELGLNHPTKDQIVVLP